eukprot:1391823-Amphidinium_carterae.1
MRHGANETAAEDVFDVAEYMLDLERNGCGKSVPLSVWGAHNTVEELGGKRTEQRWSQHPFIQATLKEVNTRLEQGQPSVKKAHNFSIAMVASLELYVVSERPRFKKAMAWARLLKLPGRMRKDDLLAADPQSMRFTTAGLTLTLRQTKTTGSGRRHRLVQCHVASDISLTGHDWLATGAEIWRNWATARDFFVPRADDSLMQVGNRMATTEEVTAYGRLVLQELGIGRRGLD